MKRALSKYARTFDEVSPYWKKYRVINLMFLKQHETYANDLLKKKGTVFLNEVYEMLGFPRTQEGQVVGWHYDIKNPIGDNCIDFGLGEELVSGSNDINIVLDFNVDGKVIQYL